MNLRLFYMAFCLTLAASCGWPIPPEKTPDVIKALASDGASGCFWLGGRGGGGGMVVTPTPVVPSGGMGSGEVLVGRVNSDNTSVSIKNGECTITRGANAPLEMKLRE